MIPYKQISEGGRALGRLLFRGRVPGQLVVQYTDHCNASCPQCGMRVSNSFPRNTLALDKTKKIIRSAAEKNIAALSFTGGEPFLFLDQICELANFAGECGIKYIRTGTNGYLFRNSESADFAERIKSLADQLAATPIRNIWVSIDSSDVATHEQMRGLPGVIKGIEKALPILAERDLYLSANLGINRYFSGVDRDRDNLDYDFFFSGFDRFYSFVRDLGFSVANVCYPMYSEGEESADAVYAATATDRVVYFSRAEKLAMFQGLLDCIPLHRDKLRIFTPRCSIHALLKQYRGEEELTTACRGGIDFFFVDSRNGHTYPCGYRGEEDLGDFTALDLKKLKTTEGCRRCDWECFRDPSELFSPLLDLRTRPLQLLRRFRQDSDFFRLWREDLLYYRSCHYFDGRTPADVDQLEPWERPNVSSPAVSY